MQLFCSDLHGNEADTWVFVTWHGCMHVRGIQIEADETLLERQESVCTCGYKIIRELEVRCCIVVVEQRHTSKFGIYIIQKALAAVVQADIVKSAQLMPWISTPRCSCMHI